MSLFSLFSQTQITTYEVTTVDAGTVYTISGAMMLWILAVTAVLIIAMWKIFVKAGVDGWKSIIPFYNTWTLFEIAGKPGWWMFLMMIPVVNFIVSIILALELAKVFGKSSLFGIVGLWLFSLIGMLMLAWGDATYTKPGSNAAPSKTAAN